MARGADFWLATSAEFWMAIDSDGATDDGFRGSFQRRLQS